MRVISGTRAARRVRPNIHATSATNSTPAPAATAGAGAAIRASAPAASTAANSTSHAHARRCSSGSSRTTRARSAEGDGRERRRCRHGWPQCASTGIGAAPARSRASGGCVQAVAYAALLCSTCADSARSEAKMRRLASLSERSWKPYCLEIASASSSASIESRPSPSPNSGASGSMPAAFHAFQVQAFDQQLGQLALRRRLCGGHRRCSDIGNPGCLHSSGRATIRHRAVGAQAS